MNVISALTARIDTFPSLPAVVAKVLEVTAAEDSSMEDLMDVIQLDQSFSAEILKLANSPFYGRLMAVGSLKQAVSVLGFTEIRNLVLSKAVFNSFKNLKKGSQFDMKKFWEHSFLCGLAGKIIAADLKEDGNECFIAGLIHDIGKLIIYIEMPDEYSQIIEAAADQPFKSFKEEKKVLDVSHDQLGMVLLKKWMFPENLLSAVGFHHKPQKAEGQSIFSMIINAADLLSQPLKISDNEEVDMDFIKINISPETIKLFETHGITWDTATIIKYINELNIQKEIMADSLNLLLA